MKCCVQRHVHSYNGKLRWWSAMRKSQRQQTFTPTNSTPHTHTIKWSKLCAKLSSSSPLWLIQSDTHTLWSQHIPTQGNKYLKPQYEKFRLLSSSSLYISFPYTLLKALQILVFVPYVKNEQQKCWNCTVSKCIVWIIITTKLCCFTSSK